MEQTKEELKALYLEKFPLFKRTCNNIVEALNIFLKDNGIEFLTITERVKDFESFFEKIKRKNYADPFSNNEDFCGIRIVLYYLQDLDRVKEIIQTEFNVQQNEDKISKLDLNEFGYRSHHFVVQIKKDWLNTPNYRGLKSIKAEIQVRTVLMHAWAEIEHELGYKNKEQVPDELKRKLFMISAKLEEADGQFQDLRNNIDNYTKSLVSSAIKKGKFTIQDFNLNSLQALLDFYFPNHEKHLFLVSDLFQTIKRYKLSPKQIVQYAERIKPLVPYIDKKLFGDSSILKTNQSNILFYALEAFDENVKYDTASPARRKIIEDLKLMSS